MRDLSNNVTPVAVTGIGLVTPFGCGAREVWERLRSGESGIVDRGGMRAGFVRDFTPERYTRNPFVRRMTAGTHYGLCAAIQAVADAGLDWKRGAIRDDVLVHYAATHPVTSFVEEFHRTLFDGGPSTATPMCFAAGVNNAAPFYIADEFGISGGILTLVGTNAEGLSAILLGCDALEDRSTNVVLAGASTEVTPTLIDVHRELGCCSASGICRPYEHARDGLMLGEGGAFVVLERLADAVRRGAKIHGLVERDDGDRRPALLLGSANGLPSDEEEATIFSSWKGATLASVTQVMGEAYAVTALSSVVMGLFAVADGIVPTSLTVDPRGNTTFDRAVVHARRPGGGSVFLTAKRLSH